MSDAADGAPMVAVQASSAPSPGTASGDERTTPPAETGESPTDAAEDDASHSVLGLTAGDRRFLSIAGAVILLLSSVHWARLSGCGQREIEISRLPERQFDFRVDVNRATWVEWMQLENIGELTARKIVADREANGPFRSIDDVDRVPGIGSKTLDAIRPWLICPECDSNAAENDSHAELIESEVPRPEATRVP